MAVTPSIVWFRDDLRLDDNPALTAAITRGDPVVAVFVLDEASPGIRPHGGAARWWLHQSLASLAGDLDALGVRLVLRSRPRRGGPAALVAETGAGAVFWNRRYGQAERDVDAAIKTRLRGEGLEVSSFAGSLLYEPWTIATGQGTPYSVFTPFWRTCQAGRRHARRSTPDRDPRVERRCARRRSRRLGTPAEQARLGRRPQGGMAAGRSIRSSPA